MMELDAIRRAMNEGVPDGPDVRCGTCALWEYVCDVRGRDGRAVDIGLCTTVETDVSALGIEDPERTAVLAAIRGEYDGAGCPRWREYEG